ALALLTGATDDALGLVEAVAGLAHALRAAGGAAGLVDPTAEPLQLLLALLGRAALARGVLGLPPQLLELFAGLALALLLAAQAVDVFLQPLQPALVLLLLLR